MAEKLVKIRLLSSISGPAGMWPAGSELTTTPKEASSLVAAGYAEFIEQPEINTADSKPAEARETSDRRGRRKRKK